MLESNVKDMPFRIKHPSVVAPVRLPLSLWRVDQVHVFHHLGEQEALFVVIHGSAMGSIDVGYAGEARIRTTGRIDGDEPIPGPVLILFDR